MMTNHERTNGKFEINPNNSSIIQTNTTKIGPISKINQLFKFLFVGYFSYSTVKEVKINNYFIGFVFRLIQTVLIVYIIGYLFIYKYIYLLIINFSFYIL